MASRAKLTLAPRKEEATSPEIEVVENAPEFAQKETDPTPSQNRALIKGLIFAGLTITSLVIFKRKIF